MRDPQTINRQEAEQVRTAYQRGRITFPFALRVLKRDLDYSEANARVLLGDLSAVT